MSPFGGEKKLACHVCHQRELTNIKRVQSSLNKPQIRELRVRVKLEVVVEYTLPSDSILLFLQQAAELLPGHIH